ncbi:protein kinase domain-containing protein [Blastococcus montanus]|uniref:protein kinase domain-containing protein n=1 Tax=Blastococcus montanus TaxID=3144973 RepID=UPI003209D8C4
MTTADTGREILGDRYELQDLIAVGGMGLVWRGRDVVLDRPVAVKVLREECAGDPTFIARFRSEARHAASLSHPNIAAVLDYGETAGKHGQQLAYLVMELVEGAPLSARISEGRLDIDATLSVLEQAAAGLAEAHRAGVVHRDVKPANILVAPDGTVKLTDFGISWSAGDVALTRTGQVIGTAQYMSPEQAMGERVGPASDVYALGLVGYESLTGHAAFEGDNPVTVALKQVREHPEPLPAELPHQVRALIDAALVKDPEVRLRDGDAFLHAVEETRRQPDGTAPFARPLPPAAPARPAGAHPTTSAPPAPRRAGWVLVPMLVLALFGVGAVLVDDPSDSGQAAGSAAVVAGTGVVLDAEDYVGRPVGDVVIELGALGLDVRQQLDTTSTGPAGTVTRLEPAGTRLVRGDQVLLHVAAARVEVPGEQDPPEPVTRPVSEPGTQPPPPAGVPPAEPEPEPEPEPDVDVAAPVAPSAPAGPAQDDDPTGEPTGPEVPAEPAEDSDPTVPEVPAGPTEDSDPTVPEVPAGPTEDSDPTDGPTEDGDATGTDRPADRPQDGRGDGDDPSTAPGRSATGSGERPGGGNRPEVGEQRGGGNRPEVGEQRGGGNRPEVGEQRGGGNRPEVGEQRGGGNRPEVGEQRGGGNRQGPAERV